MTREYSTPYVEVYRLLFTSRPTSAPFYASIHARLGDRTPEFLEHNGSDEETLADMLSGIEQHAVKCGLRGWSVDMHSEPPFIMAKPTNLNKAKEYVRRGDNATRHRRDTRH